jgi:NADH dehydrogenase FAD-containing subunit
MARTIVILGANYTGVPIAHYLLKHTATNVKDLKVVVVAPNTHMYWFVASVRGILPNMLADDYLFLPLAPEFAKYPSDKYELVLGKAERVDPTSSIVEVRMNDGSARTIRYDDL